MTASDPLALTVANIEWMRGQLLAGGILDEKDADALCDMALRAHALASAHTAARDAALEEAVQVCDNHAASVGSARHVTPTEYNAGAEHAHQFSARRIRALKSGAKPT